MNRFIIRRGGRRYERLIGQRILYVKNVYLKRKRLKWCIILNQYETADQRRTGQTLKVFALLAMGGLMIKQEDLDKIADVIWWIKGAITADVSGDFDRTHIDALGKVRRYHQDIINGDTDEALELKGAKCNCKLMLDKHNNDIITLSYWICPAHGYKNMHKDQRA